MEKFTVGTIVLVTFPFSNLKGQKVRPALVLANVDFGNLILCQITSKSYSSKTAMAIKQSDFSKGQLPIVSYARPDKLFTADKAIIKSIAGRLTEKRIQSILKKVRRMFI